MATPKPKKKAPAVSTDKLLSDSIVALSAAENDLMAKDTRILSNRKNIEHFSEVLNNLKETFSRIMSGKVVLTTDYQGFKKSIKAAKDMVDQHTSALKANIEAFTKSEAFRDGLIDKIAKLRQRLSSERKVLEWKPASKMKKSGRN